MTDRVIPFPLDPYTPRARAEAALVRTRLREARLAKGWSAEDLAGRLGLPGSYIRAFEAGETNPTLIIICTLAAHLGRSIHDLTAS